MDFPCGKNISPLVTSFFFSAIFVPLSGEDPDGKQPHAEQQEGCRFRDWGRVIIHPKPCAVDIEVSAQGGQGYDKLAIIQGDVIIILLRINFLEENLAGVGPTKAELKAIAPAAIVAKREMKLSGNAVSFSGRVEGEGLRPFHIIKAPVELVDRAIAIADEPARAVARRSSAGGAECDGVLECYGSRD